MITAFRALEFIGLVLSFTVMAWGLFNGDEGLTDLGTNGFITFLVLGSFMDRYKIRKLEEENENLRGWRDNE